MTFAPSTADAQLAIPTGAARLFPPRAFCASGGAVERPWLDLPITQTDRIALTLVQWVAHPSRLLRRVGI